MAKTQEEKQRETDLERLREQEKLDLEVERNKGPRPLEGLSGGETNWEFPTDDRSAAEEHGEDARRSWEASVEQTKVGERGEEPGEQPAELKDPLVE